MHTDFFYEKENLCCNLNEALDVQKIINMATMSSKSNNWISK